MADTNDGAPEWGHVDRQPELIGRHPDIVECNMNTRRILMWLSERGLRPVHGDTWQHPPQMTVHFGVGFGWLWGELTILQKNGRAGFLRARWIGEDGKHRFCTAEGPQEILGELERHANHRTARIRRLAQDHGVTVPFEFPPTRRETRHA